MPCEPLCRRGESKGKERKGGYSEGKGAKDMPGMVYRGGYGVGGGRGRGRIDVAHGSCAEGSERRRGGGKGGGGTIEGRGNGRITSCSSLRST